MNYDDFNTGDLLLFNNNKPTGIMGLFTDLIKYSTHSNYSHVAMVLKDPKFLHPSLKGLFVWESSWEGKPDPQDNKIKLGVQITPLQEILNDYKDNIVMLRKIKCDKPVFDDQTLADIHKVVYDKPYDIVPKDWLSAFFRKDDNPQKVSRFWCSALVGYIYTTCGILEPSTDWSILRPNDFSVEGELLSLTGIATLDDCETRVELK